MCKIRFVFFVLGIFLVFSGKMNGQQSQGAIAVNEFLREFQPLVCKPEKNCAISALSIFNALGLAYAGAKGETQSQIQKVLNLEQFSTEEEVNQFFEKLISSISSVSPEIELFQANRFYGDNEFPFLPEYLNTLQKFYNSDAVNLDFKNDPEGSREEINAWVEEVTKKLIQDLLPSGSITPDTISVLVNALYFKGAWIEQFDAKNTEPRKFTTGTGNVINVPTMAQFEEQYIVGEIPKVQSSFIRLRYKGNDFSMYIIVPKSLDGTLSNQSIEVILPQIDQNEIFNGGKFSTVNLFLPKFTVEFETILSDPLKKLGMVDAFNAQNANFGGMVDLEKIPENVFLSEGFHKAKVIVDETGTEAAAATGLVISLTSALIVDVVDFVVDVPFGFFIVKEPENIILFSGVINDPVAG